MALTCSEIRCPINAGNGYCNVAGLALMLNRGYTQEQLDQMGLCPDSDVAIEMANHRTGEDIGSLAVEAQEGAKRNLGEEKVEQFKWFWQRRN